MIQICVTEEDIKKGLRRSRCRCPIALATQRALKRMTVVSPLGIYTSDDSYRHTGETLVFMSKFDQGMPVEPFTFSLVPKC